MYETGCLHKPVGHIIEAAGNSRREVGCSSSLLSGILSRDNYTEDTKQKHLFTTRKLVSCKVYHDFFFQQCIVMSHLKRHIKCLSFTAIYIQKLDHNFVFNIAANQKSERNTCTR